MCVVLLKLSLTVYKLSVTFCKPLKLFNTLGSCVEPLSFTRDSYMTLNMHLMPADFTRLLSL